MVAAFVVMPPLLVALGLGLGRAGSAYLKFRGTSRFAGIASSPRRTRGESVRPGPMRFS